MMPAPSHSSSSPSRASICLHIYVDSSNLHATADDNNTYSAVPTKETRTLLSDGTDIGTMIRDTLSRLGPGADPDVVASTITKALAPKYTDRLPASAPLPNAEPIPLKRFSQVIKDTTSELPPHIIKALAGGFKIYIPFASCTHAACRTASRTVESYDNEISLTEKGERSRRDLTGQRIGRIIVDTLLKHTLLGLPAVMIASACSSTNKRSTNSESRTFSLTSPKLCAKR
jgi:hypothetical protein